MNVLNLIVCISSGDVEVAMCFEIWRAGFEQIYYAQKLALSPFGV